MMTSNENANKFYLAATSQLLPIVAFIFLPLVIVAGNIGEFSLGGIWQAGRWFIAAYGVLGFSIIIALFLLRKSLLSSLLLRLAAALAASLLSWNLVRLANLDHIRLWELAAFGVCVWACLRLAWPFFLRLSTIASIALAFSSLANMALMFDKQSQKTLTASHLDSSTAALSGKGNVYHIMLDGFQGDKVYTSIIKRYPQKNLDDFTYFPDSHSTGPLTDYSMAALFFGTYYQEKPTHFANHSLVSMWSQGWCTLLPKEGIDISVYAALDFRASCAKIYRTIHNAASPQREGKLIREWLNQLTGKTQSLVIVDLWAQTVIPTSILEALKQIRILQKQSFEKLNPAQVVRDGDNLFNGDYGFSITKALGFIKNQQDLNPYKYQSVLSRYLWEDMLAEEASRPSTGQYVFHHLMLPHGPYVFDRDGDLQINPSSNTGIGPYMEQAILGLKLVTEFIDLLKKQGKYDDALILIHGDHGFDWGDSAIDAWAESESSNIASLGWSHYTRGALSPEQVNSRSSILLLAKFPRQHNQGVLMSINRTQIVDIAATILEHFEISHKMPLDGWPLTQSASEKHKNRVLRYYARFPEDGDSFGYYLKYPRKPWAEQPLIWSHGVSGKREQPTFSR